MALVPAPAHAADPVDVQIIGTNDFHGRLLPGFDIPGAAKYAGAVEQFRAENPNTIFAAAGDLIGATTFESFIAQDKPTIDVLNEMDLDVSAVGNHELDQGYDDLVDRVMAPFDPTTNPAGGAAWEYIAANIEEPGGADEIAESWTTNVAGVTVGFVGAVTEHLDELVSPAGIEGLTVTDIVDATNAEADALTTAGADVVVLLVHEGAPSTDCATMDDNPASDFGSIVTGVNENVDVIMSGHTHLEYSCSFPVAEWATDPTRVQERLVVSAGQYGNYLSQMTLSVEPDAGTLQSISNENLNIATGEYDADPEVQAIVDKAEADAEGPGSVVLGEIEDPLMRATRADGSENRGGESTLGNFVAQVQKWATRSENAGDAQIAFMNPGGLRANMVGDPDGGYPSPLTYRQAADVQPFANTLVNMQLTGRQIRRLLEEQWQPEGASRPFLRLGTSNRFKYTYDAKAEAGKRIKKMWLKGEKVRGKQSYSVTANSFLAAGGDNFSTFTKGADVRDTGQTDLQGMVDYMAQHGADNPAVPDWKQHAIGMRWLSDNVVKPGARKVKLRLTSLAYTADGDVQDTKVLAKIGRRVLGRFAVNNTLPPLEAPLAAYDETGRAKVVVKVPGSVKKGKKVLKLVGNKTGTTIKVAVRVKKR